MRVLLIVLTVIVLTVLNSSTASAAGFLDKTPAEVIDDLTPNSISRTSLEALSMLRKHIDTVERQTGFSRPSERAKFGSG